MHQRRRAMFAKTAKRWLSEKKRQTRKQKQTTFIQHSLELPALQVLTLDTINHTPSPRASSHRLRRIDLLNKGRTVTDEFSEMPSDVGAPWPLPWPLHHLPLPVLSCNSLIGRGFVKHYACRVCPNMHARRKGSTIPPSLIMKHHHTISSVRRSLGTTC